MLEPSEVGFPRADFKIEIVLTVCRRLACLQVSVARTSSFLRRRGGGIRDQSYSRKKAKHRRPVVHSHRRALQA